MESKIHEKIFNSRKKNFIVTLLIGKKFLDEWKKYAAPLWKKYCIKNDIGLILIKDHLIKKSNPFWKKAVWQKMLIGAYLSKHEKKIKNVCYLDSDILINPFAPNIFKFHSESKFSVISEVSNLPFNLDRVKKKLSFNRNFFYSKKYPLDSALFMSSKEKFKFHNFKNQKNYFCSGVIVFNLKKFSKRMKDWFFKYTKDFETLTGGGEEPVMNYEILNTKKVNFINYKFQALWLYEMADKYSFLYKFKGNKNKYVKTCIKECLLNNYFLHFPGSWYEGNMWKYKNIINNFELKTLEKLNNYFSFKTKAKPIGRILPK